MPPAPIVYVMGPSGAGKDSVLRHARERLNGTHPIVFAHRYITRPPTPGDENHIALTQAEFAARKARSLFAMEWQAHGFSYGIGIEIERWREAGCLVVVSGSREHFEQRLATADGILPVLVTSDPAAIAQRLAGRGRDDGDAVRQRLERGAALRIDHSALVTIENSGTVAQAGDRLVAVLTGLLA
jgi:ribose 1,5-bisphosphokinase